MILMMRRVSDIHGGYNFTWEEFATVRIICGLRRGDEICIGTPSRRSESWGTRTACAVSCFIAFAEFPSNYTRAAALTKGFFAG